MCWDRNVTNVSNLLCGVCVYVHVCVCAYVCVWRWTEEPWVPIIPWKMGAIYTPTNNGLYLKVTKSTTRASICSMVGSGGMSKDNSSDVTYQKLAGDGLATDWYQFIDWLRWKVCTTSSVFNRTTALAWIPNISRVYWDFSFEIHECLDNWLSSSGSANAHFPGCFAHSLYFWILDWTCDLQGLPCHGYILH